MADWSVGVAQRAAAWAEAHLLAETTEASLTHAFSEGYAAILASASIGDPAVSARLLDYSARHWQVRPGEYHIIDEPAVHRQRSFLRSSCILLAATRGGRLDLACREAVERTLSYQHLSGGFFDMDPGQGHGLIEAFTTAWAGRVALRLSWHERARQAALLLAEMLYMQPDPLGRFYFVYDTAHSTLLTRWRDREPQARYVDFDELAGESHQVGMALAFLAEMVLSDRSGGWERPLRGYLEVMSHWGSAMLTLPAMATVADGLARTRWALPDAAEEINPLLALNLSELSQARLPGGAIDAWHCGLGPDYGRGFSVMESTGWTAIGLTSARQALEAASPRA